MEQTKKDHKSFVCSEINLDLRLVKHYIHEREIHDDQKPYTEQMIVNHIISMYDTVQLPFKFRAFIYTILNL